MADGPFCEATVAANPECKAWIPGGHPWHGCSKPEGHNVGKAPRRGVHVCKCGLEWTAYRRRSSR